MEVPNGLGSGRLDGHSQKDAEQGAPTIKDWIE